MSIDERNLFTLAYKNAVGGRRSAWRLISSMEQREDKSNAVHMSCLKEYQLKIEQELKDICNDMLKVLNENLLDKATGGESQVFVYKLRGDYYRYLAEFLSADERKEAADKSLEAYEQATKVAKAELPGPHPQRLGLALNFSVLYFEILGSREQAIQLAKQAFDDAISELDTLSEDSYKDRTLIMQLLRDNLTLWTSDMSNEGKQNDDGTRLEEAEEQDKK